MAVGVAARGLAAAEGVEASWGRTVHGPVPASPGGGGPIREVTRIGRYLQLRYCPTYRTGGCRLADRRLSKILKILLANAGSV